MNLLQSIDNPTVTKNDKVRKKKYLWLLAGKLYSLTRTFKMAVNKIAQELMQGIDIFQHTRVTRHIPGAAEISLIYYEQSGLSREFFLNLDEVYLHTKRQNAKFRTPNLDHVYDIFGKYSNESPSVVRTSIVDFITCDLESFKE